MRQRFCIIIPTAGVCKETPLHLQMAWLRLQMA
jgi:hypothetical protein